MPLALCKILRKVRPLTQLYQYNKENYTSLSIATNQASQQIKLPHYTGTQTHRDTLKFFS